MEASSSNRGHIDRIKTMRDLYSPKTHIVNKNPNSTDPLRESQPSLVQL
jgi:hypothetical protein